MMGSVHVESPSLEPARKLSTGVRPKKFGERNLYIGFATFGTVCLIFQAYLYLRWVLSDDFRPVDPGPDPVPGYMLAISWILQIVIPILFVWALYALVIKPYRREGWVPLEGMLFLSILFIYWMGCATNYFAPSYTFNATVFNRGSWYNFIPGWQSPGGGRVAEPLLINPFVFCLGMVLPAMAMVALMRKIHARRPHYGASKMWAIGFLMMCVFELALEPILASSGYFIFVSTIPKATLFSGHYYQFPVYETLLFSAFCPGAYVGLLYFRNDKGESIAERGLSHLQTTPRKRALIRFAAIVGAANLALLAYNVAYGSSSLFPTFKMADDVVHERSYLRDEQCGSQTGYPCPGHKLDTAVTGEGG